MALSRFSSVMPAAVEAVLSVTQALRYVRDTSGDLTLRSLDDVQNGLQVAKATTFAALSEGAIAPAAAEAFMAGLGGPATLAAYQAAAMDIEGKASAWNGLLAGVLTGLSGPDLIALVTRDVGGIETRHIEYVAFIPAATAGQLRTSQELAELIAAFEAVGA